MSVFLLIAIAFFVAALYLVIVGVYVGAGIAALIGFCLWAADQGKLLR